MMCFTDYIGDADTQWLVGWSMIASILINAIYNIAVVMIVGGKMIFLIIKKYYNIIDQRCDSWCGRMLKKYYDRSVDTSNRWTVKNGLEVLNTLDPFRVELSRSEKDSEDDKDEPNPNEEWMRKIAEENCKIIMASVIEREFKLKAEE